MPPFTPKFTIIPAIASALMRIEAPKEAVAHLPITASVLASLRESARLYSTHYSTLIEGNRLTREQVSTVVEKQQHFPGRERDEKEVLGYYAERCDHQRGCRTPLWDFTANGAELVERLGGPSICDRRRSRQEKPEIRFGG